MRNSIELSLLLKKLRLKGSEMFQHKVVSLFNGPERFQCKILSKGGFLSLHQRLTSCHGRTLPRNEKSPIF